MAEKKNYKKTLITCYIGFITQAIVANFTPLLFLRFHNEYNIPLGEIALISTVFYVTQIVVDTLCATIVDRIGYRKSVATVYKGNIIKNLIMDCQSYTKYRPNETTGGIFVSWRRKEELPTGA